MSDFALSWSDQARKDLKGLPSDLQLRIARKVESARHDPLRFFERLKGENVWRMRVGDYRVIADIGLGERTLAVIAVGHRKSIYR